MNPATGTLTGTPTVAGGYVMNLSMTASGASGVVNFSLMVQIDNPSPNAWALVNSNTPFPRFATQAAAVIGSDLYVVGSREDNLAIETWRSIDLGTTWVKLPVAPSLIAKDFALASDGTRMILSGGRDANDLSNNLVFLFQGNAWQSVPATGSVYSARWGHSLTAWNGAWWIIGGTSGSAAGANAMADVWQSSDNGASWTQTTNNFGAAESIYLNARAPTYGHCAGVVNNTLVKVGGSNSQNAQSETGLLFVDPLMLWQSADGINWTLVNPPRTSPQDSYTYAGCATVNGALQYIGGTRINPQDIPVQRDQGFYVWSSMWTFNGSTIDGDVARMFDGSAAFRQRFGAATAAIGSKLFLIGGRNSNASNTTYSDVWVSTR
jgi:hypothetical protein